MTEQTRVETAEYETKPVPEELFGKDHWSTLAYIETRLVDYGKFLIESDPRMRTCRRCWRIQADGGRGARVSDYPTVLTGGLRALRHCDWDCLQDLVTAGILKTKGEPDLGKMVKLTEKGYETVAALRRHKTEGGTFATFRKGDPS